MYIAFIKDDNLCGPVVYTVDIRCGGSWFDSRWDQKCSGHRPGVNSVAMVLIIYGIS